MPNRGLTRVSIENMLILLHSIRSLYGTNINETYFFILTDMSMVSPIYRIHLESTVMFEPTHMQNKFILKHE